MATEDSVCLVLLIVLLRGSQHRAKLRCLIGFATGDFLAADGEAICEVRRHRIAIMRARSSSAFVGSLAAMMRVNSGRTGLSTASILIY